MASRKADDSHSENKSQVSLNERGMLPFVTGELDGRIHDPQIEEEPSKVLYAHEEEVGAVKDSIDNFPTEIVTERYDGVAVRFVTEGTVHHSNIASIPRY